MIRDDQRRYSTPVDFAVGRHLAGHYSVQVRTTVDYVLLY